MFRRLKVFGIATSRSTILNTVDKMTENYDRDIKSWQEAVSDQEAVAAQVSTTNTTSIFTFETSLLWEYYEPY